MFHCLACYTLTPTLSTGVWEREARACLTIYTAIGNVTMHYMHAFAGSVDPVSAMYNHSQLYALY